MSINLLNVKNKKNILSQIRKKNIVLDLINNGSEIEYGVMTYIEKNNQLTNFNILYTDKNIERLCKFVDKFIIQNINICKNILIYEILGGNARLVSYDTIMNNYYPYIKIFISNLKSFSKHFPYIKISTPIIIYGSSNNKKLQQNVYQHLHICAQYKKFVHDIKRKSQNDIIELYNDIFDKNYMIITNNKAKRELVKYKINILQNK